MVNKSPTTKRLGKNHFRIVGRSTLYIKGEVITNFTPLRKCKSLKNIKRRSILPTFNNDSKHYTLAFHLPSSPLEPDAQALLQHDKRVVESTLQISEIMMPKPRSKQKYCGVCRGHYQDYKEHIQHSDHLGFLKHSHYQNLIVHLCKDYQQCRALNEENARNIQGCQMSSEEFGKFNGSLYTQSGYQIPIEMKKSQF